MFLSLIRRSNLYCEYKAKWYIFKFSIKLNLNIYLIFQDNKTSSLLDFSNIRDVLRKILCKIVFIMFFIADKI